MFAIIDIETTGNICKYGFITEIAIYQHNGTEITGSFSTLVNPQIDIPYHITKLTGIDNQMIKNAPRFFEIAKQVVELTAGRTFVAHNVHFDYSFIKEEFNRLGYNYTRKTLCTVQLARKFLPGFPSYSLGNLCKNLKIEINGRHRAAGDALATVKLFELILQQNEEREKQNVNYGLKLF